MMYRIHRTLQARLPRLCMTACAMLLAAGSTVAADGESIRLTQQTLPATVALQHRELMISGSLIVALLLTVFWLWLVASRRARTAEKISHSLSLSQKRLQYALEGSGLALWDYDIRNDEIYLDAQWANILGQDANGSVLNSSEYSKLIHPEDVERVRATLQAVLADEVPSYRASYRFLAVNDNWKWVRAYGKVVERDAQGKALRLTGTIADITLQKHMQEELHTSESRWQFALEGADEGVWDWNVATNKVFFSRRWKQMLGYAVDELDNRFEEWESRVHPEDLERCYRDLDRHYHHETPVYQNEQRLRCKDGSYKWILARGKVIEWDNDGKPIRIIGTHTDITERRRMQETLDLQARAMEASMDGILIADATQMDVPIVYCNRAFEDITGYSKEEILGHNCRFLQATDQGQPELDKLRQAQRDGRSAMVLLRNYRKDGSLFWNELSISPVHDDNGKLTNFIGISHDVTGRIKAKEALRREYEFSTTAINALPGAFFVLSKQNKILRLNDNVETISGYSHDEMARMQPQDFFAAEDHELIKNCIVKCFQSGHADCEARVLTKSGELIPYYLQSQTRILDGEECLVGTGTDISALKRMQQELIHSQSLLNTIVEHIPAMVFLKQADDLSYVLLNKAGEQILEYKRDEVLGKTDQELFTPEQAQAMTAVDREVLESKQARILPETRFCSSSGWTRYLYTIKTVLCDENEQVTHLLGIAIDVTEHKLVEQRLLKSEEQLKEAQHIAQIGHWSLDFSTDKLQWSDEIFRIFGRDKGSFVPSYESFFDTVHPDDVELVKKTEQRAIRERIAYSLDHRIVRSNGEIRWVHEEAGITWSKEGEPLKLIGTVQDITTRKQAEQAVEYSEARLRSILETAVDSVIIIDSNGIIESVNPATEKIFGFPVAEMLGNNVSMLMPDPDRSAHDGYLQQYQTTHQAHIIGIGREVIGRRKDGSTFPMDLAVSEMQVDGRRMFTGFVRDISLRKQAESELLKAKEQAEQASRAKSEFLSNMSHELRTPMNAILGFAQLLQVAEPPLTQPQQQEVKEILVAGQHLLELINGLLDLARIEAGHMEVSIEPVSVEQALNECIQMIEPIRQKHEVTIRQEYHHVGDVLVSADRIRLRQILLNLLSNAVKYNKVGGSVSIRCEQKRNDHIRIEVEDTGIGIAPEHFDELFKAFSRLGGETYAIEGTGIGLAVTRQLVELMHGEIGVSSQAGVGSNFWLELPAAQAQESLEDVQLEIMATPATQNAERTVLYIEDNTANIRFMEQLLRRRPGLQLLTATGALSGLELAQTHQPDLILLDIHLPEMNGFEVLQHLQGYASTRDIPVIAVSANAMSGDIERARKAGFVEYCTKPIEIEGFLRILDLILNPDKLVS